MLQTREYEAGLGLIKLTLYGSEMAETKDG
jgi:hypothetical protein